MQIPPLTILVVDDVPQNLVAMQALLAGEWQEVLCARSGAEALELLLQHEVALALLDVQMPGMDGYTLAELMRGTERTRHVPIIFLTAGNREDSRTFRGYEAGAVDFLYKPVDPYVLRTKVDVFLDLYRQRQRLNLRVAEHERLLRVHSALLRSLSQDLREPLAALRLNAEALLRRVDPAGQAPSGLAPIAQRIKANAALVARHVDHLVNLGRAPVDDMQPQAQSVDLERLVADRVQASVAQGLWLHAPRITREDESVAECDPNLISDAIDQVLLHLALHAGDAKLDIEIDGRLPEAVLLRWMLPHGLGDEARDQLTGDTQSVLPPALPAMAGDAVGDDALIEALRVAVRAARAHGGTLVVRSRDRDGTRIELMLPRRQSGTASEPPPT